MYLYSLTVHLHYKISRNKYISTNFSSDIHCFDEKEVTSRKRRRDTVFLAARQYLI